MLFGLAILELSKLENCGVGDFRVARHKFKDSLLNLVDLQEFVTTRKYPNWGYSLASAQSPPHNIHKP